MIALTCDIFGSDVWQADRKDRSEAEDLIKQMRINATRTRIAEAEHSSGCDLPL
jgi:hypothetical protein